MLFLMFCSNYSQTKNYGVPQLVLLIPFLALSVSLQCRSHKHMESILRKAGVIWPYTIRVSGCRHGEEGGASILLPTEPWRTNRWMDLRGKETSHHVLECFIKGNPCTDEEETFLMICLSHKNKPIIIWLIHRDLEAMFYYLMDPSIVILPSVRVIFLSNKSYWIKWQR